MRGSPGGDRVGAVGVYRNGDGTYCTMVTIDATIEWQWAGGHVPGEVLGNSLPLWVDFMFGLRKQQPRCPHPRRGCGRRFEGLPCAPPIHPFVPVGNYLPAGRY